MVSDDTRGAKVFRLAQYGFDPSRLNYAFRTALAACLALFLAWRLGLEHPQWAAMTVWAASQPTRGQLFEKSFYRMAGTVCGAVVGVALAWIAPMHPVLLVGGLALWVAVCTGVGNLQRGFLAYGTVLAGYSAAMVALLNTGHPEQVLQLGADRLATVLTGVLVATFVGYCFAPRPSATALRDRVTGLLADILAYLAEPRTEDDGRRLLARVAAIEEELELHGAGSVRSKREMRAVRGMLLATVPLLLWRREDPLAEVEPAIPATQDSFVGSAGSAGRLACGDTFDADVRERLGIAAQAMRRGDAHTAGNCLAALARPQPQPQPARAATRLEGLVIDLGKAIRIWGRRIEAPLVRARRQSQGTMILHRDWMGAWQAALRAGGTLLLVGAVWLVTGWSAGPYMLLGFAIMISVFSSFENPAATMRFVILGQVFGVLAALACRWLLWPLAGSEWQLLAWVTPFILVGALLTAHGRLAATSVDYNMVLLLLLQPVWPLTGAVLSSVMMGLAVLSAPVAAWAAYHLIYPVDLQRRSEHLVAMMVREAADFARNPRALTRRQAWRIRFSDRTLKLIRISERMARPQARATDLSLAFFDLGGAVLRCHQLLKAGETTAAGRRAAQLALRRAESNAFPLHRLAAVFSRLALRLSDEDARLMRRAASAIPLIASALKGGRTEGLDKRTDIER
ncbi:MAG: FUSC family protein [Pigmentiphaga sp.]